MRVEHSKNGKNALQRAIEETQKDPDVQKQVNSVNLHGVRKIHIAQLVKYQHKATEHLSYWMAEHEKHAQSRKKIDKCWCQVCQDNTAECLKIIATTSLMLRKIFKLRRFKHLNK